MFSGNFAAQPVDVIVIAFDFDDIRFIDQIAQDLRRFQVAWNNTIAAHAGRRRMGRTELARLPVDAQATVSNPSSRARVSATATTRSLKERVG
jgi:hypothetical protein